MEGREGERAGKGGEGGENSKVAGYGARMEGEELDKGPDGA